MVGNLSLHILGDLCAYTVGTQCNIGVAIGTLAPRSVLVNRLGISVNTHRSASYR